MLRSRPIIEYGPNTLITITFLGSITAFFAASTGLVQNDLKRVIAYSTCSQIGYLFIACGLSQYNVALFHLVNHAFFKALLFLSAGAVLHATYDEQDQRKLGGLQGFLPFAYTCILIGSLSLIALPFITGYYSKDLILELAYGQFQYPGQIAYYIGTISASFTAFYSLRLISITFITYPNANKKVYKNAHDPSNIVIFVLIVLRILAIFYGYISRDLFVGIGSDFLNEALFVNTINIHIIEAEFGVNTIIKLLPLYISLGHAVLCVYIYHVYPLITNEVHNKKLYVFLNGKYLIDVIYNYYSIYKSLYLGYTISKTLDRGWVEQVGPYGLEKALYKTSVSLSKLDNGNISAYALYITIQIVAIIFVMFQNSLFNTRYIQTAEIMIFLVSLFIFNTIKDKNNLPFFKLFTFF